MRVPNHPQAEQGVPEDTETLPLCNRDNLNHQRNPTSKGNIYTEGGCFSLTTPNRQIDTNTYTNIQSHRHEFRCAISSAVLR